MRKLTKGEQIVLKLIGTLQSRGIYLCIELANSGGVAYIEPVLSHWKKVKSIWDKKGSHKHPEYTIDEIFYFQGKEYTYLKTIFDQNEPIIEDMRRATPTIIKKLTLLGLIKPGVVFVHELRGKSENPERIGTQYEDWERDYFFVPFEIA